MDRIDGDYAKMGDADRRGRRDMKCPICSHDQYCPCTPCLEYRWADGLPVDKPWVWLSGDKIACGYCGWPASADWWLEEEMKQMEGEDEKAR